MLAAAYELRLAKIGKPTSARRTGRPAVDAVRGHETGPLVELRELAHGIFPAILTEAGSEPALRTFADRAPLPMEIDLMVGGGGSRPPRRCAAYVAVTTCVAEAAARGVGTVLVTMDSRAVTSVVDRP